MDQDTHETTNVYSIEGQNEINILTEIMKQVGASVGEHRKNHVARKNIMVFRHGREWSGFVQQHDDTNKYWKSSMERHRSEVTIPSASFKKSDFLAIFKLRDDLITQMCKDHDVTIFKTIDEATIGRAPINFDINNNLRQSILEMWSSIKLGLNDDYTLSTPNLALDQTTFDKLKDKFIELDSDEEFTLELKWVKRGKWLEAMNEHLKNILKFELHENDRRVVKHQLRKLFKLTRDHMREGGRSGYNHELTKKTDLI